MIKTFILTQRKHSKLNKQDIDTCIVKKIPVWFMLGLFIYIVLILLKVYINL